MGARSIGQSSGSFAIPTGSGQPFAAQTSTATTPTAGENIPPTFHSSSSFDLRKQFWPFFTGSVLSGPALKK